MKLILIIALLLVSSVAVSAGDEEETCVVEDPDAIVFPDVVARNLEEEEFSLPEDFVGDYTVILIAYQIWHQLLVNSWVPTLGEIAEEYGDRFAFYELPVLDEFSPERQQSIDAGMVAGIPDEAVRAITITIYTDVDEFNEQLGGLIPGTMYLLVLDSLGQVVWQDDSQYTPSKAEALRETIDELMAEC